MAVPPLSSFSALCAEIADWVQKPSLNDGANPDVIANRLTLGPVAPVLIALAEADMRRRIDVRQMENTITFQIAPDGSFTLPADFGGASAIALSNDPTGQWFPLLSSSSQDALANANARQYQYDGFPRRYTISGGQLLFTPAPVYAAGDTPITGSLTYRRLIPALSLVAPTNWLLQAHPDAYLWGSLAASAPYVEDDSRLATWRSLFDASIEAINMEGVRERRPVTSRMRVGMIV